MNKVIFVVLFSGSPLLSKANPYVEVKNSIPFIGKYSQSTSTNVRLGYEFNNNMYIEGGLMNHGKSYEAGYKFIKGKWTFKGKLEGAESHQSEKFRSKLETEIRYTFGD